MTCSFRFCTCLAFLKKAFFFRLHDEHSAVNLESFGLYTLSNTENRKPYIISKHGLVLHKFNILLSEIVKCTSILNKGDGSNTSHLKPGLHFVVTIAEHASDDAPKRILRLPAHRLQIFLVNMNTCDDYNYVRTKACAKGLKNVFATMCLRSLRPISVS